MHGSSYIKKYTKLPWNEDSSLNQDTGSSVATYIEISTTSSIMHQKMYKLLKKPWGFGGLIHWFLKVFSCLSAHQKIHSLPAWIDGVIPLLCWLLNRLAALLCSQSIVGVQLHGTVQPFDFHSTKYNYIAHVHTYMYVHLCIYIVSYRHT